MAGKVQEKWETPNISAADAILTLHSTRRIAAPASLVFRILRNTETWRDWNKFVPRVDITYQPPDEDEATSAEIEELVRNTSLAGSYDSDLTDGMVGSGDLKKRLSESNDRPMTPPLKLRRGSHMSGMSSASSEQNNPISVGHSQPLNGFGNFAFPGSAPTDEPKHSGAQKSIAAQNERKPAPAAGSSPPPAVQNVIRATATEQPAHLSIAATPPAIRRSSLALSEKDEVGRRNSKTPNLQKAMKARQNSLNLLYGEPSVRLQQHTRMTFFARMNPRAPGELKQTHFTVTEVSRPDDPVTDGKDLTHLTRSNTHTLNRMSVYRIVWAMDNTMASLLNIKNTSAFPKSMLATERVHEIRPITLGDGSEECEVKTWELQKGPVAKMVKKKYEGYLQSQFEVWTEGLANFCEGLVGKVDRRDFSTANNEENKAIGIITFYGRISRGLSRDNDIVSQDEVESE